MHEEKSVNISFYVFSMNLSILCICRHKMLWSLVADCATDWANCKSQEVQCASKGVKLYRLVGMIFDINLIFIMQCICTIVVLYNKIQYFCSFKCMFALCIVFCLIYVNCTMISLAVDQVLHSGFKFGNFPVLEAYHFCRFRYLERFWL